MLQMRFNPGPEDFRLPAQLHVVVKYLALLVGREIMHVDDDLAFPHKGERALFQIFPRTVIYVVARGHDDLGAFPKHRPNLGQNVIPAADEIGLVLGDAKRII